MSTWGAEAGYHRPARMPSRFASALLLPLVLTLAGSARADDTDTCVATNEKAQKLRREKKLRDALEELKVCSQPTCPTAVRRDCTEWLREVETAVPTLSFTAKDGNGQVTPDEISAYLAEMAKTLNAQTASQSASSSDGSPVSVTSSASSSTS